MKSSVITTDGGNMKLEKTRVTMPAACSRRVVTSALSLLLFTCVAVRPLVATLVHVQGPTVLQPREFCSDHPDAAIATFEDAELEAEIRDALRESVGAQKDLTCGVISGLTLLDASYGGIMSLAGIQNLTGLTILELNENNWISDISALSGLTSLTQLWLNNDLLGSNLISDISALSGLTSLERLHLGGNSITDISALSGLTSLTDLRLMRNSISGISALRGLTSLTRLYLHTNPDLTDIQPLLDNTGLGAGDTVVLTNTNVSCTDLAALEAKGVTVGSTCP